MTTTVLISHGSPDSRLSLRVTDYMGTKEIHPGQSGEFYVYAGSQPIEIAEFDAHAEAEAKRVVAAIAAAEAAAVADAEKRLAEERAAAEAAAKAEAKQEQAAPNDTVKGDDK